MAVQLAFISHHNFYPKPKIDLDDAEKTPKIKQKLTDLQQKIDDIISKHSSNIRLTHLEEMKINTDPNLPPVASNPFLLPLKHHIFVKEKN